MLIDVLTGIVLDYEVLSNTCRLGPANEAYSGKQLFELWQGSY